MCIFSCDKYLSLCYEMNHDALLCCFSWLVRIEDINNCMRVSRTWKCMVSEQWKPFLSFLNQYCLPVKSMQNSISNVATEAQKGMIDHILSLSYPMGEALPMETKFCKCCWIRFPRRCFMVIDLMDIMDHEPLQMMLYDHQMVNIFMLDRGRRPFFVHLWHTAKTLPKAHPQSPWCRDRHILRILYCLNAML